MYLADGTDHHVTGDLNAQGLVLQRPGSLTRRRGNIHAGRPGDKNCVPLSGKRCGYSPKPLCGQFLCRSGKSRRHRVYVAVGTKNLTGAGTGNDKNAVIKRNGLQISFTVRDADTGGSIPGVAPIPTVSKSFRRIGGSLRRDRPLQDMSWPAWS